MFWLATARMLLRPIPPTPTAAMFRRSLGGVKPLPSTCRGTMVSPAPVIAAVSMKCRRDTPLFLSSIPPPFARGHDIPSGYDNDTSAPAQPRGRGHAVGAPQAARSKPGPWKSLFDGKSLDAWRIFKSENGAEAVRAAADHSCWQIKDGVLWKDGNANDMITKEQFGDFELELEWKIGKAGNSGIFYRGTEDHNAIYWSAPEYQLLDNIDAADNKRTTTSRGRSTTSTTCPRTPRSRSASGTRRGSSRRGITSSTG